jgi:hypothetical protein
LEALILSTIVKRDDSTIDISAYNISANDFRALFDNVLKKHPELFDVATNRAYGDQQLTSFHAEYLMCDGNHLQHDSPILSGLVGGMPVRDVVPFHTRYE